jgi:glycosyltransferase involved in cell wall biosynthesis
VPTHYLDRVGQIYPLYKILWASRLCEEKRPDLLVQIASQLKRLMPALHICAFGSADPNSDWINLLADTPGLEYYGPFNGFDSLQPEGFDAFLYTSSFDGLPNVVLEAMGWGLPVIAPDVGGISEAVRDGETGFLIPDHGDDDRLIAAYVAAIQRLYQDWARTRAMAEAGRALVAQRHNRTAHKERIRQLFAKGARA